MRGPASVASYTTRVRPRNRHTRNAPASCSTFSYTAFRPGSSVSRLTPSPSIQSAAHAQRLDERAIRRREGAELELGARRPHQVGHLDGFAVARNPLALDGVQGHSAFRIIPLDGR